MKYLHISSQILKKVILIKYDQNIHGLWRKRVRNIIRNCVVNFRTCISTRMVREQRCIHKYSCAHAYIRCTWKWWLTHSTARCTCIYERRTAHIEGVLHVCAPMQVSSQTVQCVRSKFVIDTVFFFRVAVKKIVVFWFEYQVMKIVWRNFRFMKQGCFILSLVA